MEKNSEKKRSYKLIKMLGGGSFGKAYLAENHNQVKSS